MKHDVEMGSGALMYITSSIKTGSGIHSNVDKRGYTDTQHDDLLCLILFF
jgi:hypothetical protein